MNNFEQKKLYNPEFTHEHRLSPRATIIPALHKGVFYKNRLDSEMVIDLNGDYKFCYRNIDDIKDFHTIDFDDDSWNTLPVPSMWQYHGYSAPVYPNVDYPIPFMPPYVGNNNPVGYYRKRFNCTLGGHKILYFGGVDSAFFVYLNGQYVGFSKGSRIPAEFDVTNLIVEGENILCVKVFTYSDGTYLENQDMLLASGIFRDVMLYTLNDTYVWDYCTRTENNTIIADISLNGSSFDDVTVRVSVDGMVQSAGAQKDNSFRFEISNPIRWNAEIPYTYEITIELIKENVLLEMHTKKIGFAEYVIDGSKLLLNGQQITLKGINRHEHDPKNGRAIIVERIENELRLIKDHNMNAIRCAHYPNNPAFYEICTELGIYVMNEADIETHGAQLCGDMGYFSKHPQWYSAYFDRVSRMYERDKNETCISIWTIGNENGDGENVHKCIEYLKSRDVKKPVMNTGDDYNNPKTGDFRSCGYFSMGELAAYAHEGKPLMMLEYGHAMGNSPGLMKDTWDFVYRNRYICGGYVWEFKSHGFYSEDEEGNAFYKYGGDFNDVRHWGNFSIDGYCLSDGTPKPSLRDCKNVLAPTYLYLEDDKLMLMNTNDFRALDYVTLKWEIAEDYTVKKTGEMKLPAIAPYDSFPLDINTDVDQIVSGAEYFLNLHFYDDLGNEIAYKQASLGIKKPKESFLPDKCKIDVEESENCVILNGENFQIRFTDGLLSYINKNGEIVIDEPMRLNIHRAPIDNDGIINDQERWQERWIGAWNGRFYRYFDFVVFKSNIQKDDNGNVSLTFSGKWAPLSKYVGFDLDVTYTVTNSGNVLVDIHGKPYGVFSDALPRIGVIFTLEKNMSDVLWYGRGEDECYVDRCHHCNLGLYNKKIEDMNFMYDVPQECGTRIDTRFVNVNNGKGSFAIVGSDSFAFSYHDFTLDNLTNAKHRNEIKKSDKNYLYVDYAMRGLGSQSCGPAPEEKYELRPHEFRFAFMIVPNAEEGTLLELSRKQFNAVSERLSDRHTFDPQQVHKNVVDCIRE